MVEHYTKLGNKSTLMTTDKMARMNGL